MTKLAVIGGSGVYKLDTIELVDEFVIETPFGQPSSSVKLLKTSKGDEFYFIPRHGEGHIYNPSEINYRANIYALKTLGVDKIVSISAVGSLKEEHAPGKFVIPSQFLDWTKGLRKRTFFEKGVVGHVSAAELVNRDMQKEIAQELQDIGIESSLGGTYVCIEGPQFSSRAESALYRSFGADIIGMTNLPEANLAKEAGIAYVTVAMVTDYDCWKDEHCTVEEIMKVMKGNYEKAQKLITGLVSRVKDISVEPENKYAIVSNMENLDQGQKEIISTLLND